MNKGGGQLPVNPRDFSIKNGAIGHYHKSISYSNQKGREHLVLFDYFLARKGKHRVRRPNLSQGVVLQLFLIVYSPV